ncbi:MULTISPECIES: type IV toxin-antitoxin system AbiEi family antitoxin [Mycobacteriaceae]|uniref:Type IV toxin-antitoxin system AbiEi family antitoxin n=1 Tax=Mycolicibacterium parafortuitum TaxID=39692 RepID=A0ACC6MJC2_MYCPF|nr:MULTISPECIES: type IV toxin-antitoxin system AbiEi family antitoxin [Mycobacteriaceae]MDZ5087039.1 type IV toxin-antitoxin system AbiEi family antitoxin [Mycolicibacterium parafortuitum]GFM19526.1 hypothetical protein PO1_contig-051-19 [Mycobacterium sp. PO1]GFM23019.1 hypothetical protein PO2_contig-021-54 [Mycobacterium sp. PO2]
MGEPFIGSEAVRSGRLTPYALRSRYRTLLPGVYLAADAEITAITRAKAGWLWTGRAGVVAGQSAASLHGAKWVDARRPAEVLWSNRHAPRGVTVWSASVADDELEVVRGVRVTTPARTALDIACRYPLGRAVAAVDALARATKLKLADVEMLAERHRGRRGIRRAREALDLVDAGAESPQETRIRLLLIRAGFPRPETQIPVYDDYGGLIAELDMGWRDRLIAVDYEGDHHRRTPREFNKGIRRHDAVTERGWDDIRVTSADTDGGIVARVRTAWQRRA